MFFYFINSDFKQGKIVENGWLDDVLVFSLGMYRFYLEFELVFGNKYYYNYRIVFLG